MMGRIFSEKEIKLLFAHSGNICAFPGCTQQITFPDDSSDDAIVVSQICHIVADSHQGPRGGSDLTDEERNKHTNLILLCPTHHKIIDSQPTTYSIPVLRHMKKDHETRIQNALSQSEFQEGLKLKVETVYGTLMPLTHLPKVVYSAPCGFKSGEDREVKSRIKYPTDNSLLIFPFLLREGKLFAFQDLKKSKGPFSDIIDHRKIDQIYVTELCSSPEGQRVFITLLNKSLFKYAGRQNIRYDANHHRYFFQTLEDGVERSERYRPLNANETERKVAWRPLNKKTGEHKNFWWHLAASLRFERVDEHQWYLSIRPERHLTLDGINPLSPEKIGPKVTRKKARMYNNTYLAEVQFWRDYLSRGTPRIIMKYGEQSLICDSTLPAIEIKWPGISEDKLEYKNQEYEEDLFSLADLDKTLCSETFEWDNAEDEDLSEDEYEE